ncbi:MAG: ComF family protein [Candidatus Dojkabacteria bacterium]
MEINLIDTFFPSYCLLCKRVGAPICTSCIRNKIFVNWNTYCCVCNSKVKKGFIHDECKSETYLDGHFFVTSYNEGIKELIMQGKYSYNYHNFEFIALLMRKFIKFYNITNINNLTILTPIPLSRKKKLARGFNQSEVICKELVNIESVEVVKLLVKVKDLHAQAELNGSERRENLLGAFKVDTNIAKKLNKECPIILVDDVFTTGSTLNECAKTLKEYGFISVYGYTFAKAGRV